VEIRRTIHRVDPCIARAVHSADKKGEGLFRLTMQLIIGGTFKAYCETLVSPVI
jgi:hypothetical protein